MTQFASVFFIVRAANRLHFTTTYNNLSSLLNTTRRTFSTRMDNRAQTLVSPQWLADKLKSENKIKVVDASWCMPNEKKDIYADHSKTRIPGAVLFDIDAIADKSTNLPHMLPSVSQFENDVGKLGISNDDVIVAYDSSGKFVASARVWWTFRVFGHKNVAVLDGGLPLWLKLGLPTEGGTPPPPKAVTYKAVLNKDMVKTLDQVRKNIENKEYEVIDARPPDRFNGSAPEPRPGLKSGHIPNSKSVPIGAVLDINNFTYLKNDELINSFKNKGVDVNAPIITTCGSGVTASVLSLGLHLCGIDSAVYDGSFSEYGQPTLNNPVHTK